MNPNACGTIGHSLKETSLMRDISALSLTTPALSISEQFHLVESIADIDGYDHEVTARKLRSVDAFKTASVAAA
jgi:hypothetical protein